MFSIDKWQEILDTMRHNKLRTFLTAFSVAWGIFMLVVLLGAGHGLENGIAWQFRDDATNSIWVYPGKTSVPYRGLQPGRDVRFTDGDHEEVEGRVEGVEHITSRYYIRARTTVSYEGESGNFDIRSVHPDHRFLENTIVTEGRFLNELDIREHRKVAAIGKLVKDELFGDREAIGREIEVNGIAFKVVGTFEDEGGEGEMQKVYLPITTAQRAYGGANRIDQFMLTTGEATIDQSGRMADEIKDRLAQRHVFSPDDRSAVYVNDNNEEFQRFAQLMQGIKLFIWIVGIGTIGAGVVGVSNIMLIVVRERTKEFGIRKALGATPWSIVSLIVQEAVFITAVAGYVGLFLGVLVLESVNHYLLPADSFFRNPTVDLGMAIYATLVLVLAGTSAGLLPALRAAQIRPIEALRDE